MRLGYHRKVPLEFLSEPPFWSYVQNKVSTTTENTGILPGLRTRAVTQREPRRIKIPGLGKKIRRTRQHGLAQAGYFYLRLVERRKGGAQIARFSSIWLIKLSRSSARRFQK
jgi:hypothetical protein